MSEPKIKVLYIAGFERSGSTIINRVLGQIEGFVAWGELRDIWQHGIAENRSCSCGNLFADCPAWQAILTEAFGDCQQLDLAKITKLQRKTRSLVLPHHFGLLKDKAFESKTDDYLNALNLLYQAIHTQTNSKVVVDSTKASWYGYVLNMLPVIDMYVVHVVRNPRGICYSLERRKQSGEPECQWYNPVHASLSWIAKNYSVEMLLNQDKTRYLRIRYEDFTNNPRDTVKLILNLVRESDSQLPFEDNSTVKMGLDHLFTGSPSSRATTGSVKLKPDEKWKTKLKLQNRATVSSLTLPLSKRYGY